MCLIKAHPVLEMASLSEAYDSVNSKAARQDPYENPQTYERFNGEVEHVKASRRILGLVGGNEVSFVKTNWPDVESDLRGITRPNTDCAARKHLPPDTYTVQRKNPKQNFTLDMTPINLKESQFWAYPSVVAPQPLKKETCGAPHKY